VDVVDVESLDEPLDEPLFLAQEIIVKAKKEIRIICKIFFI